MHFTITSDSDVTFHDSMEAAQAVQEALVFSSANELAKLPTNLVELHNSLTGVTPVKKFKTRTAGAERIWKLLQTLVGPAEPATKAPAAPTARKAAKAKGTATTKATPAKRAPKAPKRAKVAKTAPAAKQGSKSEMVLALIRRAKGATLDEIMTATGWQKHSVRGFIAGYVGKKLGLAVESTKSDKGERTYKLAK